MPDKNIINLNPKRCIYVKNSEDSKISEIYFSNYYLKQVIDNITDYNNDNPNIIKFDDSDFMNVEIIPDGDKELMANAKQNIPEKLATKDTKINKNDLDILDYSKITYTHAAAPADGGAAPADGGAAPDGTAVLNPSISEDEILQTLSQPIEINGKVETIFKNKAQLRQYLKYDGLWYLEPPKKYDFKNRKRTGEEEGADDEQVVEQVVEQGGGKKTTTRRRRKAGYNKHRKSNRRR